jgi:hypothetical protein
VLKKLPGIFLGGTTLHGVGINACTTTAERLANNIVTSLPVVHQVPLTTHHRMSAS